MEHLVFILAAAVSFFSACAIVSRRNPVYAVLFMLPLFLGLATIFVQLSAPFMAAMLVMVYGGAILVVFLFVIMLINLQPEEMKVDFTPGGYLFPAILAGLFGALVLSFALAGIPKESGLETGFARGPAGAQFGSIESLSQPLFERFLVPFELVSVLIVVALLGVVLLGRKRI
jgi:NADH-quinone oxidoreductase subunit J